MFSAEEIRGWIEKGLAALPFYTEPQGLDDPVIYMVAVGGKRLRPTLCLLSYNLFKKEIDDNVLMPALGLELFHAFTLAHDDIMDAAEIRRGQPTLHRKWNTNTAILAGDVLCMYAYSLIAQCPTAVLPTIMASFSQTAIQVCEGQQYDMQYEHIPIISHEQYEQMIAKKTAVLIADSARIGALCGGANNSDAAHLYDFGFALGMGFQIWDDYLDTFGNNTFGKTIGGDILNNKKTWLLVDALQKAVGADQKELNRLLYQCHDPQEKINGVVYLYRKLDVPLDAEAQVNHFHTQATEALEKVNIQPPYKESLYQYAASLLKREK